MLSSSDNVVQYTIITTPAATYTIPFKYWDTSEIKAKLSFADAADETLDYTSDFTVSAAGDSGTLTRVGTWTADAIRLTIYRELAYLQETDYRNGDVLDAEAVEKSIDRLTALSQQIAEQGSRQVTVPITDTSASLELPSAADRAGKLLAFDDEGNAYPGVEASAYTAADVLAKLLTVDGSGSGLDSDLVQGHELTAQTPLNSGLACAPQATVPEWPDGANDYFQNTWASEDGWSAVSNCTVGFNSTTRRLIVTATGTNPRITKTQTIASKSFRMKVYQTTGNASTGQIGNSGGTTSSTAFSYSNKKAIGDHYFPAGAITLAIFPGITGSANGDVYEIEFIYIGDGSYTSIALDGSGLGNHATVSGATPVDTVAGRGFSFDGVNDVAVTTLNVPAVGSASLWITPSAIDTNDRPITDTGGYWLLYFSSATGLRFGVNDGSSKLTSIATVAAGSTYHVVCVWTGSVIRLYVNGTQVGSDVASGSPSSLTAIRLANASSIWYAGIIADPRIYNRALSAEEIWELYSKPGMAHLSGPQHSATATPNSIMVRDALGENKTIRMANGQGIDFSAGTEAAGSTSQLLADYEEGTWTPAASFNNGTTGITYGSCGGKYTKIGDRVFFSGLMTLTANGSDTGQFRITGLPFTSTNAVGNQGAVSVKFSGITYTGTLTGRVSLADTKIVIEQTSEAGTTTAVTESNVSDAAAIQISGHYYV